MFLFHFHLLAERTDWKGNWLWISYLEWNQPTWRTPQALQKKEALKTLSCHCWLCEPETVIWEVLPTVLFSVCRDKQRTASLVVMIDNSLEEGKSSGMYIYVATLGGRIWWIERVEVVQASFYNDGAGRLQLRGFSFCRAKWKDNFVQISCMVTRKRI